MSILEECANHNVMMEQTLMNCAIVFGWGINLFGIITTGYDFNISVNINTLLVGIGNLVSVSMITILKIYRCDEKRFIFTHYAHELGQIRNDLTVHSQFVTDCTKRKELYEKSRESFDNVITKLPYDIPNHILRRVSRNRTHDVQIELPSATDVADATV